MFKNNSVFIQGHCFLETTSDAVKITITYKKKQNNIATNDLKTVWSTKNNS